MPDPFFLEILTIVGFIVQTHHCCDSDFLEGWHVIVWSKSTVLDLKKRYPIFVNRLLGRRTESHKFLRYYPVEVSIFQPFIMLVFSQAKSLKVEPSEL